MVTNNGDVIYAIRITGFFVTKITENPIHVYIIHTMNISIHLSY